MAGYGYVCTLHSVRLVTLCARIYFQKTLTDFEVTGDRYSVRGNFRQVSLLVLLADSVESALEFDHVHPLCGFCQLIDLIRIDDADVMNALGRRRQATTVPELVLAHCGVN